MQRDEQIFELIEAGYAYLFKCSPCSIVILLFNFRS